MRIAIVTDAWEPQVNGVVRTLSRTRQELDAMGHEVMLITPAGRRSVPMPSYPEIRLSLLAGPDVRRDLSRFAPDCIHIATEGPLGLAARAYCQRGQIPFTTAYHTQFPEYVRARAPVPLAWTARLLRWFHGPAVRTMVPTEAIRNKLTDRGFENVVIWSRGVDTGMFNPATPHAYPLEKPIWIYLGRVAVEKNIEAFLNLELAGSKVVIGDGPDREALSRRFPHCRFLGYRFGRDLADHLAGADVFVFPSKTDTFGLVMLEAMACGLPVAALPVDGPIDVVRNGETGILDDDLRTACLAALELDRKACRRYAKQRSWRRATEQFEAYLAPRVLETASDQPASS
ncbi:MAG: glycosyltransferase family 1 protein [Pseudomonadota bacterium]